MLVLPAGFSTVETEVGPLQTATLPIGHYKMKKTLSSGQLCAWKINVYGE